MSVHTSRESLAEILWRYGEDELAIQALDIDDATLLQIAQRAVDEDMFVTEAPMLDTLLARGAVAVLEGRVRDLARKRRRPEASERDFWLTVGEHRDQRDKTGDFYI